MHCKMFSQYVITPCAVHLIKLRPWIHHFQLPLFHHSYQFIKKLFQLYLHLPFQRACFSAKSPSTQAQTTTISSPVCPNDISSCPIFICSLLPLDQFFLYIEVSAIFSKLQANNVIFLFSICHIKVLPSMVTVFVMRSISIHHSYGPESKL